MSSLRPHPRRDRAGRDRNGRDRTARRSGSTAVGLPRRSRNRLVAVLAVIGVAFALITWKLVSIQGLGNASLQQVNDNYISVQHPFGVRGSILASNGDELAYSELKPQIYADPLEIDRAAPLDGRSVPDERALDAAELAPVLRISAAVLERELGEDTTDVVLASGETQATADAVGNLALQGVASRSEPVRFDPDGDLASGIIGGMNDLGGDAGLEFEYNRVLSGSPGELVQSMDATGSPIPGSVTVDRPAVNGDDVMTTLNEALEYQTQQILTAAVAKAKAKGGTAIVMDTRTGALLAVDSVVAAAHQTPVQAPGGAAFTNVYEPGSVAKIITISGALTDHAIGPWTKFTIPDQYAAGGSVFSDAEDHPTEVLSPTGILAQSSNIGAIQVGQRLGAPRLYGFEKAYGLTRRTAVDFPGESDGLVLPLDRFSGTTLPTMAFGEANAVTAAQMIAAVNTVANGGTYVSPRLVTATVDAAGRERTTTTPAPRRVIPASVAETVTHMLEQVVSSGTGTAAGIGGYDVAGKTGTANVNHNGLVVADHYVSSFAGFAPAEDPAITAMVVVDDTGSFGAAAAAPAFSQITRDALFDLGLPSHGSQPRPELAAVPIIAGQRETSLLGQ